MSISNTLIKKYNVTGISLLESISMTARRSPKLEITGCEVIEHINKLDKNIARLLESKEKLEALIDNKPEIPRSPHIKVTRHKIGRFLYLTID